MSSVSKSPMEGYAQIKPANQQIAEMQNAGVSEFEVWDVTKGTRETIEAPTPPPELLPTTRARRKRKPQPVISPSLPEEYTEDVSLDTSDEVTFEKKRRLLNPMEDVVFVTPWTEVSIATLEIYRDANVFSIITPEEDRVKVRPKRGATLEVKYRGETIDIYASGIYIPVSELGAVLSVFFIVTPEQA